VPEPELVDLTPAPAPTLAELRKAALPDERALVHRLIHATRPRGTRGWPLPGSVAPPMAAAGSSLSPPSETQFEVTMALAFTGPSAGPRRRSSNSGLADALAGTQACSFAGRTVLTVVHESTRVPSFRGYHAPRNSPNIVPTPA
jgi:hypothetical protein